MHLLGKKTHTIINKHSSKNTGHLTNPGKKNLQTESHSPHNIPSQQMTQKPQELNCKVRQNTNSIERDKKYTHQMSMHARTSAYTSKSK